MLPLVCGLSTSVGPWYLPMSVTGFEAYVESPTMYNNYGLENYQVGAIDYYGTYSSGESAFAATSLGSNFGTGWYPASTSSVSSYGLGIGLSPGGVSISVSFSMPTGTESISTSNNPSATPIIDGYEVFIANLTWTYNIGYGRSNAAFPNAFEDDAPALFIMPSFEPSQQYSAAFHVDFENNAITAQYPCTYETLQTIWTQTTWKVVVIPQSSTTASLVRSIISVSAPPSSYVSGATSYLVPIICPYLST
ncbi:MAG: hypothetical protein ACP5NY_07640 [Thermocladium sp.]